MLSGQCTYGALRAVPIKEASFTLSFKKKIQLTFCLGKISSLQMLNAKCDTEG